jgi:hypothetical protein
MPETTNPATNPQKRNVTIDVYPPQELWQPIVASIKRYRVACAKMYATLLLAQQAGATIEVDEESGNVKVHPRNDNAKLLLAEAMGTAVNEKGDKIRGEGQSWTVKVLTAKAYEIRDWFFRDLYPSARAFVYDSARRDICTVWRAPDPEFPQATRGWLSLQLARGPARFARRAIGFARLTGKPQLEGRKLILNWDHDIGKVTFDIPKLEGARYGVWRPLRDGDEGWKLGTLYLTVRESKHAKSCLSAIISYTFPAKAAILNPAYICNVTIDAGDPDVFIHMKGPHGAETYDSIAGHEAVAWLRWMYTRRQVLEARRAACGNPRRPWGHRKGWRAAQDVLSRLTDKRELGQKDRNHAWTRRIATRCRDWGCGSCVINITNGIGETGVGALFGLPWSWTQFEQHIKYKLTEIGATLEFNLSKGDTPCPA